METTPPWVILERIVRADYAAEDTAARAESQAQAQAQGQAQAQAEAQGQAQAQAQHAAAAPNITLSLTLPPRVTVVSARRSANPTPRHPDPYPYIISGCSSCLLAHFSVAPFLGTNFYVRPQYSHLVVLRDFQAAVEEGQMTATAERVVSRPGFMPTLMNIMSVVLASNNRAGDYRIAELHVVKRRTRATIVDYHPSNPLKWRWREFLYPLAAENREWFPHGAVFVDRSCFWFDLSWGVLSHSFHPSFDAEPELLFHDLPDGRRLQKATKNIHSRRCITVSQFKLCYVEIIPDPEEDSASATVNMWTRKAGFPWFWIKRYETSFEDIWNDDSYKATRLPRKVPVLAVVCPSDPDVVYFTLDQHLFGVRVPVYKVVHCEVYELAWTRVPASGRFLMAWALPPAVA